MRLKYSVLILSSLVFLTVMGNTVPQVNAEELEKTNNPTVTKEKAKAVEKVKVVLPKEVLPVKVKVEVAETAIILAKADTINTKAVNLNKDIVTEISKVKKERKIKEAKKEAQVKLAAEKLNAEILAELARVVEERRLEEERLLALALLEKESIAKLIETSDNSQFGGFDVRTKSNLTGEKIDKMLEGTALAGLGFAYSKAEHESGINALVLIGISALESSWGKSKMAQTKNNLFGFQAYDYNTDAARTFETKEEGISVVAAHLNTKYLTPGGPYHNGYTLKDINVRYASDKLWNVKITGIMNRLTGKLK
jgi:beta-N-acetylglucosaminidase